MKTLIEITTINLMMHFDRNARQLFHQRKKHLNALKRFE